MIEKLPAPELRVELARSLAQSGSPVRLAMRGTSMLPLLHQPQVLEVAVPRGAFHIGQVVVFRRDGNHVAHRIVGFESGFVLTSGDAQPHVVERVAREDILGCVQAVWSGSKRVDTAAFRVRGWFFARFHALRRTAALAGRIARNARAPWNRPRPFGRLYAVFQQYFRGKPGGFACALRSAGADVIDTAIRHRCAGFLNAQSDMPAPLQRALLGAQISTMGLARDVELVVQVMRTHGIPVALLKGAARVYTGGDAMYRHPSADLDILVPDGLQDAAVEALVDAGYEQRATPAQKQWYCDHHHHAAPVYRRGHRPVEVHRALAPGTIFGTPTTWRDLAPHLHEAGPGVYVLDAAACALHAAMHATISFSFRDVVFLSDVLRKMTEIERRALCEWIHREPLDTVRLGGVLVMACDLAGIPVQATMLQQLYRHWIERRDDLPVYLRKRAQAVDAAFLLCSRRPRQAWRALCLNGGGPALAGRIPAGIAAVVYALLMKDAV